METNAKLVWRYHLKQQFKYKKKKKKEKTEKQH